MNLAMPTNVEAAALLAIAVLVGLLALRAWSAEPAIRGKQSFRLFGFGLLWFVVADVSMGVLFPNDLKRRLTHITFKAFFAGCNEELAKAFALFLALRKRPRDANARGTVAIGLFIALCLAAFEDLEYAFMGIPWWGVAARAWWAPKDTSRTRARSPISSRSTAFATGAAGRWA